MGKKLHAAPDVQLLVNSVMPWVETRLREDGQFLALAAWLPAGNGEPQMTVQMQLPDAADPSADQSADQSATDRSIREQEGRLAEALRDRWLQGELAAVALVAPMLYGRAGSGERSMAVRLHIETQAGYCADILMPYRIRAASRWRGSAKNRVHFSHPVAQESDPLLGELGFGIAGEERTKD